MASSVLLCFTSLGGACMHDADEEDPRPMLGTSISRVLTLWTLRRSRARANALGWYSRRRKCRCTLLLLPTTTPLATVDLQDPVADTKAASSYETFSHDWTFVQGALQISYCTSPHIPPTGLEQPLKALSKHSSQSPETIQRPRCTQKRLTEHLML